MRKVWFLPVAAALFLTGCATLPAGPNVMVLPSEGKDFDQFRYEDAVCRQWAAQQIGTTTDKAATDAAVGGAAVGTVLGGAAGAAVGAAYGDPATGAAVGAGLGLLGGSAVGADNAAHAEWTLQHRYDVAYMQCMYAKGNQIPMPIGYQRPRTWQRASPPPPPPGDVPPPPAGNPPPPPPGYSR
jgi:Glycine-zipper domain